MLNSGIVKVGTGKAQTQPVLFSAQPTIHYIVSTYTLQYNQSVGLDCTLPAYQV